MPLDYVYVGLFALAVLVISYGAVDDIFNRSVNQFLFVPVLAGGLVYAFVTGGDIVVPLALAGMFVGCFFSEKQIHFLVLETVIFAVAVAFSITLGIFGFPLVIGYVYVLVAGLRYMGVGDVKAVLSLITAFPYPLFFLLHSNFMQAIPFSFYLMLNSSLASLFFIPYVLALNFTRGALRERWSFYALPYDEEEYRKNDHKYKLREISGKRVMIYQIPALVPITIGFLAVALMGI